MTRPCDFIGPKSALVGLGSCDSQHEFSDRFSLASMSMNGKGSTAVKKQQTREEHSPRFDVNQALNTKAE